MLTFHNYYHSIRPREQTAAWARRRGSDVGDGTALCAPGGEGLGSRLRLGVSHRWLSGVSDGFAHALWAVGTAPPPPGPRPCAEAALDACAAVALCPGRQDGAAAAPGAGASPCGVWHPGAR